MKFFTILLFLGGSISALAGNSATLVSDTRNFLFQSNDRHNQLLSTNKLTFDIDQSKTKEIFSSGAENIVLKNFPIGDGESKTLVLKYSRPVFDAQTQWLIGTKDGEIRVKAPDFISYSGVIEGETGSRVIINEGDGELVGTLTRSSGIRYSFSRIFDEKNSSKDFSSYALSADHILNQEIGSVQTSAVSCSQDDISAYPVPDKNKIFSSMLGTELREVKVAVEGTYDFYNRVAMTGTDEQKIENAQRYIASVFAMVSRIYEDEANTVYYLPYVKIYTSDISDPYIDMQGDGGGIGDNTLDLVQNYWNNNTEKKKVERHVVHILMGKPTNPNSLYIAGIARPSGIANKSNSYSISCMDGGDYGKKYPALTYTWDVGVIAHEIGHNFSSPHTHVCNYWNSMAGGPLDSCVTRSAAGYAIGDACTSGNPKKPSFGSIMSYCHLAYGETMQMSFGPIVSRVIRSGAERYLPVATKPVVKIQYPFGREKLIAGGKETIRWTSAMVSTVKIEFSTNSGQTWEEISTNNAADRKALWTIPNTPSVNALVRVYDIANPVVADTSFAEFSMQAAQVALETPNGGERVAQGEKFTIKWESQLVDSVKVEYSTDGGTTWIYIGTSNLGSYIWDIPDELTSDQVKIRLTGIGKVEVIKEGGEFAVGNPIASIMNLKGGETLRSGSQFLLRWKTDFVNRMTIRFTTNGGTTWANLNSRPFFRTDIDTVLWNLPNVKVAGTAKVQILNYSDKRVLAETNFFSIADTVNSVENEEKFSSALTLSPNPVQAEAIVKFVSTENTNAKLSVVDETGQSLMTQPVMLSIGENIFSIDGKKFSQGAYRIVLEYGENKISLPVNIIR